MKLFKCKNCGYIHEGNDAPSTCPKCGALKESFEALSQEESDKVYNSERTNDIHTEIINLSSKITSLCKEGIDINLDPGCVSDFKKAKDESWVIKQRSKAELATHMKKGKW